MSIDANIAFVEVNEDGSGTLHLCDRIPNGSRGQSRLHFETAPYEVTALNGLPVWGGDSSLLALPSKSGLPNKPNSCPRMGLTPNRRSIGLAWHWKPIDLARCVECSDEPEILPHEPWKVCLPKSNVHADVDVLVPINFGNFQIWSAQEGSTLVSKECFDWLLCGGHEKRDIQIKHGGRHLPDGATSFHVDQRQVAVVLNDERHTKGIARIERFKRVNGKAGL